MKYQTIISFALLSLFTILVPSANADTSSWGSDWRAQTTRIDPSMKNDGASLASSSTTIMKESVQTTRIDPSMKNDGASLASSLTTITKESVQTTRIDPSKTTESATVTEASDTPVYAESLKKDEIIEKHKHHVLLSDVKRRPWL